MANALKASASDIFITTQAVKGTIDSNPEFTRTRRTDGRISQQNTFEKSAEIKSNLQGAQNTLTNVEFNNEISVEVTQNINQFIPSILMDNGDATPVSVTASTISFDDTANTIADSGSGFGDVEDGQWIFVTGAADSTLNIAYYVVTATSALLTCSEVGADEAAGASVTVEGTMLRSGNTESLLTVQGRDTHTGATNDIDYKTQFDTIVDTLNITTPSSGIMTGSATLISASQNNGVEPISGQTDAADDTSNPLGSANGYNGFFPDQATEVDKTFTDISFDIVRNSGTQDAAGTLGALCVEQDIIGITGTLTSIRKADDPAVEETKYDNSTRFSMSFIYQWDDDKQMVITMRNMVYTDGSIASSAGDFANFAGTYDAEEDSFGTTIQFDLNF